MGMGDDQQLLQGTSVKAERRGEGPIAAMRVQLSTGVGAPGWGAAQVPPQI